MRLALRSHVGFLAAWLLAGGCAPLELHPGKSPLAPARSAADSVGVEVLFIRWPANEEVSLAAAWGEMDETSLPLDLRRSWEANGLRAGIAGEHPPAAIERLLNQSDAPISTDAEVTVSEFQKEPPVRRRELWLRPGRPAKIAVLGEQSLLPELTLLTRGDDGLVSGKSYHQVKGLFQVRAEPQSDGRVALELVPQLEHGEPRQRYVPSDSLPGEAMVRFEFGQDRESFANLRLNAVLAPGQMLVLGSTGGRPGSLGDSYFESGTAETAVRKLVLLRLTQSKRGYPFDQEPGPARETIAPASGEPSRRGAEQNPVEPAP